MSVELKPAALRLKTRLQFLLVAHCTRDANVYTVRRRRSPAALGVCRFNIGPVAFCVRED